MTARKQRKDSKRPIYTDAYRATAVAALVSEGYPENQYAISRVAGALNIPSRTLRRWATGENNPPPDDVVASKKSDMAELIETEVYAILGLMPSKRKLATYGTLAMVLGTLIDKLRLLRNLPTEIIGATAELTELAVFFRENNIEMSSAVREWRTRLEAKKAASGLGKVSNG